PPGCRRRNPSGAADAGDYQGEPLLGIRLQRRGDPTRGCRSPQPDDRGGCGCRPQTLRPDQHPPVAPPPRRARGGERVTDAIEQPVWGYTKDKEALIKRLHRIEGQVRGVERMVEEDRYCIEILTQIAAVNTALESLAFQMLDQHVRHCVAGALASGD